MFHPKAEDGGGKVIARFLLLGIKADTLADDGGLGACGTPDRIGHFEADGEDTLTDFVGAGTEGMSVRSKS